MVEALQAFALKNYDKGGHWVYETHTTADYEDVLVRANGNLKAAKAILKEHWQAMLDLERECAFE